MLVNICANIYRVLINIYIYIYIVSVNVLVFGGSFYSAYLQ